MNEPDLILIYRNGDCYGFSFEEFELAGGMEEAVNSGCMHVFHKKSCTQELERIGFEPIPVEFSDGFEMMDERA